MTLPIDWGVRTYKQKSVLQLKAVVITDAGVGGGTCGERRRGAL